MNASNVLLPVMVLVGWTFVALAWSFVLLRVVHSLIHLTYNRVRHRMLAFATGTFVLMYMWGSLLVALLRVEA